MTKQQQGYSFLRATEEDLPLLQQFYNDMNSELDIHGLREDKIWTYMLKPSIEYDPSMEIWLLLDKNDEKKGYFRVTQEGFGEGLIIRDTSKFSFNKSMAVIKKLKEICQAYNRPYLRFVMHENNNMVKTAKILGARNLGSYAWQIFIPDIKKFLTKITPLLEDRMKNSPFFDLSETFYINIYKNAIELKFVEGKIKQINMILSNGEESHVSIPSNLIIPFLFGYRTRKDLMRCAHDFSYNKKWENLIDILFPRLSSFIYTIF